MSDSPAQADFTLRSRLARWWARHGVGAWSRASALRKFGRWNAGRTVVVDAGHGLRLEVTVGDPVGTALAAHGTFEPGLTAYLAGLGPQLGTVVDVGCNLGYVSCLALAVGGPGTRVVAIDANPAMVAATRGNLARNRLQAEVLHLGVGREAGELTLHVPRGLPSLASAGRDGRGDDGAFERIAVPVQPLSAILRGRADGPIGLLKIDIEGYEPAAFAGLAEADAARIARIVFEVSPAHLAKCGFGLADLWAPSWWERFRLHALDELGRLHALPGREIPAGCETLVAVRRDPAAT